MDGRNKAKISATSYPVDGTTTIQLWKPGVFH